MLSQAIQWCKFIGSKGNVDDGDESVWACFPIWFYRRLPLSRRLSQTLSWDGVRKEQDFYATGMKNSELSVPWHETMLVNIFQLILGFLWHFYWVILASGLLSEFLWPITLVVCFFDSKSCHLTSYSIYLAQFYRWWSWTFLPLRKQISLHAFKKWDVLYRVSYFGICLIFVTLFYNTLSHFILVPLENCAYNKLSLLFSRQFSKQADVNSVLCLLTLDTGSQLTSFSEHLTTIEPRAEQILTAYVAAVKSLVSVVRSSRVFSGICQDRDSKNSCLPHPREEYGFIYLF